jgi:uncharacterized protein (DUF1697 family)
VAAYVALLRGIAPTNPKMKGAELRRVFESLSFDDVRTVIASGNVLFGSPGRSTRKLEDRIEDALEDHLGAPCSTIVWPRSRIEELAASHVFDGYDDSPTERCNVTFLKNPAEGVPAPEVGEGAEIVAAHDDVVFSVIDTTAAKTPDLMRKLEQAYGKQITTRTWKTVHRIAKAFAT